MPGNKDPKERAAIKKKSEDKIFIATPKIYIRHDDDIYDRIKEAHLYYTKRGDIDPTTTIPRFIVILLKHALSTLGFNKTSDKLEPPQ